MLRNLRFVLVCFAGLLILCSCAERPPNHLKGKVIVLDPGHGGTAAIDTYRVGPTGEREEWINLRVALELRDVLEEKGASVLMTRTTDSAVNLQDRALLAVQNQADVFVSVHHNATADSSVNFPIIYFHGNASENRASVALGKHLAQSLIKTMYHGNAPVSLVSDHTIFPAAGTAVLRYSYGIPAVIAEASFFTNPGEEQRLKDESYNLQEANAYVEALESFFGEALEPIEEKYSHGQVEPFRVFQEAERMNPVARNWRQDYENGKALLEAHQIDTAYQLLTRSARSFPDSWVAGDAHRLRAEALDKMDSTSAAAMARKRVDEFYVTLP